MSNEFPFDSSTVDIVDIESQDCKPTESKTHLRLAPSKTIHPFHEMERYEPNGTDYQFNSFEYTFVDEDIREVMIWTAVAESYAKHCSVFLLG